MKIQYQIFKPSGNDTALVSGTNFDAKQKKIINDEIMKKHKNVEQVGFLSKNGIYELQMAGGEFCGNATRSAVFSYLNGNEGNIKIIVNKDKELNAGVTKDNRAWTEIPLYNEKDWIEHLDKGVYIVKMDGMRTIVMKPEVADSFLKKRIYSTDGTDTKEEYKSKEELKQEGMKLIKKYHLEDNEAVGVMICERVNEKIKINPIVWVRDADTLFYETACGSGTTAVGMVDAFERKSDVKMDIIQPSGMEITVKVIFDKDTIKRATIEGYVMTDDKQYDIIIAI